MSNDQREIKRKRKLETPFNQRIQKYLSCNVAKVWQLYEDMESKVKTFTSDTPCQPVLDAIDKFCRHKPMPSFALLVNKVNLLFQISVPEEESLKDDKPHVMLVEHFRNNLRLFMIKERDSPWSCIADPTDNLYAYLSLLQSAMDTDPKTLSVNILNLHEKFPRVLVYAGRKRFFLDNRQMEMRDATFEERNSLIEVVSGVLGYLPPYLLDLVNSGEWLKGDKLDWMSFEEWYNEMKFTYPSDLVGCMDTFLARHTLLKGIEKILGDLLPPKGLPSIVSSYVKASFYKETTVRKKKTKVV